MTTPNDPTVVSDLMLDESTVDHLLDGLLAPEDVPSAYARVVGVVRALSVPPTAAELSMQAVFVQATIAELALRLAPNGSKSRRKALTGKLSTRTRFFKAKVASLVLVGTLIGTTGLAVAGALPAPLQDAASKVLAKVGISVPSSDGQSGRSSEGVSNGFSTSGPNAVDPGSGIGAPVEGHQGNAGPSGKAQPEHPAHPTHPGQPAPPGHPAHPNHPVHPVHPIHPVGGGTQGTSAEAHDKKPTGPEDHSGSGNGHGHGKPFRPSA
jgi:hypothetical protein